MNNTKTKKKTTVEVKTGSMLCHEAKEDGRSFTWVSFERIGVPSGSWTRDKQTELICMPGSPVGW